MFFALGAGLKRDSRAKRRLNPSDLKGERREDVLVNSAFLEIFLRATRPRSFRLQIAFPSFAPPSDRGARLCFVRARARRGKAAVPSNSGP